MRITLCTENDILATPYEQEWGRTVLRIKLGAETQPKHGGEQDTPEVLGGLSYTRR